MEIITFGVGGRLMRCATLLSGYYPKTRVQRLVLLPIPTTRDGTFVNGTDLPLYEVLSAVTPYTMVAGYGIPKDISEMIKDKGAYIYDAGLDEAFLAENALVTAHGTLGHILSESLSDISDMKIGIIGYGRIGSALTRLLLFIGAEVRVYTKRTEVAKALGEDGVLCETVNDDTEWAKNELIINTAPAKQISEEKLFSELKNIKIIDLASGKTFPEREGITKLPSIPEKMYPETAGRIYAKCVKRAIEEVRQ